MKSLLLLICISILSQPMFSQPNFSFQNEVTPKISGRLIGYDPQVDEALQLQFAVVVPTPERNEKKNIKPKADGTFELTLKYPLHYQQIWFSIGDYYYGELILDNALDITVDLLQIKNEPGQYVATGVTFTGPDGAMNEFVNQYVVFKNANRGESDPIREIMMDRKLSPEEKTGGLRQAYAAQAEQEKRFRLYNPSPFDWILENERLSRLYGEICVIHWGKEMPEALLEEVGRHRPRLISNAGRGYYNYLGSYLLLPSEQERWTAFHDAILPMITIAEEADRLRTYLQIWEQKLTEQPYDTTLFQQDGRYFNLQYEQELYATAQVDNFKRKVAQFPGEQGDLIKIIGGGEDIWKRDLYVKTLLPTITTPWCTPFMERDWEVTRKKIEAANKKLEAIKIRENTSALGESIGKLPNTAELFLANQPELDTLLAAIRASVAGKAVLLDIWATWCAPCIHDMQNSSENLQKLKTLGVEVVYLCVASGSSNEANWQKKVAEMDLPTKHLFLNPELSKSIMSYFALTGYPSHVFLDKQGQYHPELIHSISRIDLEAVKGKL